MGALQVVAAFLRLLLQSRGLLMGLPPEVVAIHGQDLLPEGPSEA